ncbi:MAG: DUF6644 family protein [Vicinamibacterales bacterium]
MLLPYFQWCESSWLGQLIPNSLWMFPVVEAVHLLGLAVIGGAVLVVDLRLLGLGLRNRPVSEMAREAQPYLIGSLIVMISTGVPLFFSEAIKCYYSDAFWVKMPALALAILFTFTIRRWVTRAEAGRYAPTSQMAVGAISLMLWSTVGMAGRWIGFS